MDSKWVAIIASSIFSLAAFSFSLYSFKKSRGVTLYQDIDRLYLEVLKMRIEHPEFADPQKTRDFTKSYQGNDRIKYEAYAFIVWNICETIADRENEGRLFETWEPVLRAEADLHRAWFDKKENQGKFKPKFRKFINDRYPRSRVSENSLS
jgi:hypothetical protein